MKYTLSIIVILICIIYVIKYKCKDETNIKRHLTDEYHFAHFSKINNDNIYFTPSILFTSPISLVLRSGESLWIPKKWWHWIKTKEPSIAINFWSKNEKYNDNPIIIKNTYQKKKLYKKILNSLSNKDMDIDIWKSDVDEFKKYKYDGQYQDNSYIISLPGYNGSLDKSNVGIYEKIVKYVTIPDIFKNKKDIDINFWISLGYHDTGLHYDDYDGLLCVLKGEKHITLYPPSDSCYLKPICVLPSWVKSTPIQFEYNTYTHIKILDNNSFPSSRLLYESVKSINNKKILQTITDFVDKCPEKIIWGCKYKDGVLRWEMYMYHYTSTTARIKNRLSSFIVENNKIQKDKYSDIYNNDKNLIIHSYDIYQHSEPIENEIHLYYKKDGQMFELPFIGRGTTLLTNGEEVFESQYILDNQKKFKKHFKKYTCIIGFKYKNIKHLKKLVDLYSCTDICIHRKNSDEIFIQFLGISIYDFIKFLEKYNYPKDFQQHVKENKERYIDVIHEIAIVFNIVTLKPVRTAFYGIV